MKTRHLLLTFGLIWSIGAPAQERVEMHRPGSRASAEEHIRQFNAKWRAGETRGADELRDQLQQLNERIARDPLDPAIREEFLAFVANLQDPAGLNATSLEQASQLGAAGVDTFYRWGYSILDSGHTGAQAGVTARLVAQILGPCRALTAAQ